MPSSPPRPPRVRTRGLLRGDPRIVPRDDLGERRAHQGGPEGAHEGVRQRRSFRGGQVKQGVDMRGLEVQEIVLRSVIACAGNTCLRVPLTGGDEHTAASVERQLAPGKCTAEGADMSGICPRLDDVVLCSMQRLRLRTVNQGRNCAKTTGNILRGTRAIDERVRSCGRGNAPSYLTSRIHVARCSCSYIHSTYTRPPRTSGSLRRRCQ
jgi:hypothetical protein